MTISLPQFPTTAENAVFYGKILTPISWETGATGKQRNLPITFPYGLYVFSNHVGKGFLYVKPP